MFTLLRFSFLLAAVGFTTPPAQCSQCAKNSEENRNITKLGFVFHADFKKSSLSAAFDGARVSYGDKNVVLWESGNGIDVTYPKGSYVPSGPVVGGFGIWTNHRIIGDTAVFKYSLFFPIDFNFVKEGKLPGLYGGKKSCSGGYPARNCFSSRIMWRQNGQGELYLYANRNAQDPTICRKPNNDCNPKYGWSLDRGAWIFPRNKWNDVEQRVTLNTPGKRDGIVTVKINGKEVIRYCNIVFRTAAYPDIKIDGMDVETFFGGNGPDWASPSSQVVKFKNFILLENR